MARFTFTCFSCSHVIETDTVYRTDRCPKCEMDVKTCRNCRHYDDHASNECREPAAEYVYTKDRANYCDYFDPRAERIEEKSAADDARAKLEALFKK